MNPVALIRRILPLGVFTGLVLLTLPGTALSQVSQDELNQRIADLERELAELKALVLQQQAGASDTPKAATPGAQAEPAAKMAEAASSATEQTAPATVEAGIQGAPNPLQDDRRYLTGQDLLDEAFPNSIPIFGSDVRFRIGGYAKLDFIQDLDYVGNRYEFATATIPVEGTPEAALDGRTTMHAKQTRLNFDFRSKAHWGDTVFPLQAFLEMDFFEDREDLNRQPRLRHAYGVVGRLLAGQTWSISADLEALPGYIDFNGGDALYGDRVAQIRWQDSAGERITWAIGVEDPKSAIHNPFGLDGADRSSLPNLAGKVRWTTEAGSHFQVGGDVFQLNWQGGETGPSDKEIGYGINLTGRLLLGANGRNALLAGGSFGHGSSHRTLSFEYSPNDAVITPDGLDVMSTWQAYAGFSHYWSDSLNSTIGFNWAELDNSEFQPDDNIHGSRQFHANLIWFPYRRASTGFEVMYGERENKDGAKGDAWRLQYMLKYKFN